MHPEYLLVLLAILLLGGGPLLAIVLSIVAIVRTRSTRELARRVERLEATIRGRVAPEQPPVAEPAAAQPAPEAELVEADVVVIPEAAPESRRETIGWETFIGQKALGWIAIVLLILAAAFFLRYAYQNNWIGPLGRVAIGALVGTVLVIVGQRYQRRGWRVFSQMLSSGGVVVLYLATYSAFGFYHLLPYEHAGIFLGVIVVESMVIAALYDSLAIGLVAVLGGLLTPLLLYSEQDAYVALFTYLAVLDLGTLVLMLLRVWPAIGSVALLGTHGIFWSWYAWNYHPEKLAWALGFQVAIYGIFLAHTVVAQLIRKQLESWEGLVRLVLNAALWFSAFYILMKEDYGVWMGSAAIVTATVYALLARFTLTWRSDDRRLSLCGLSVSVGFIAMAFPIQADAHWVAFGWAATAATLWWFGQRVAAPALRMIAAVLAGCALFRVLVFDMPHGVREPFIPVFNDFGLPSVGVVACILAAVVATRPFLTKLGSGERFLTASAGVAGVLLLWLILSVECYGFFEVRTRLPDVDPDHLRWLGQLSLSVLWAVYASIVLAIGFGVRLARLRWLAIAIYGLTVAKVLLVDMANLQQFYRILAFFILAIVLGLAAFAYQRLKPSESRQASEGT